MFVRGIALVRARKQSRHHVEVDLLENDEEQSRFVCLRQHLVKVAVRICLSTVQLERLTFFDFDDARVQIGFLLLSHAVAGFTLLGIYGLPLTELVFILSSLKQHVFVVQSD